MNQEATSSNQREEIHIPLADQLDLIDRQFEQQNYGDDHVMVDVDEVEERRDFPSNSEEEGEDEMTNMSSSSESDSDEDAEHPIRDTESIADTVLEVDTVRTDAVVKLSKTMEETGEEAFKALKDVPAFQQYVQQLVSEEAKKDMKGTSGKAASKTRKDKEQATTPLGKTNRNRGMDDKIKSPSDTTLYSPALKQVNNQELTEIPQILNMIMPSAKNVANTVAANKDHCVNSEGKEVNSFANRISQFIEGVHAQTNSLDKDSQPGTSGHVNE